jgi:diguanylate cyclase (GGDEF)-like protein/PAS domain S-box-containing protein
MNFGPGRLSRIVRASVPPIVTGLAYYTAALVSLSLTQGHDGIAAIWPSSGILLTALLISSRQMAGWHIAAAAIASLAANLGQGNPWLISLGFTIANMAESALAAWLIVQHRGNTISWSQPARLWWFCVAATIATVTSASIATAFIPSPTPMFWFSWFSTDLLGILIVTPLLMIVWGSRGKRHLLRKPGAITELAGVFGLVAALCAVTFAQSTFPMLFLPMIGILIAVFRLGPLGAAGSVLIVTVASSWAIVMDSGPLTLMDTSSVTRSLFLQFYLLALFAAALPVAALLASGRRLQRDLRENVRLLQLAESTAQVGHWRLDIASGSVNWSPEVFKIHGLNHHSAPMVDEAINAYHPDDRQMVEQHIEKAIESQQGFEFNARIIRPDGEVRHVFSRGEFDHAESGGSPGLFGVIRDVTTQVAYEKELRAASARALRAAEDAKIMAETDQLTGVANRRRVYAVLESAISNAQASGEPMAVTVFDIDHFKSVNDRFGHQAGDDVIRRVTRDASRHLRGADLLGRLGGEEFVIVLPAVTTQIAMQVAERVRQAVQNGGANPAVTISLGLAEWVPGDTVESLLNRADQALYIAKSEGRNALRLAA